MATVRSKLYEKYLSDDRRAQLVEFYGFDTTKHMGLSNTDRVILAAGRGIQKVAKHAPRVLAHVWDKTGSKVLSHPLANADNMRNLAGAAYGGLAGATLPNAPHAIAGAAIGAGASVLANIVKNAWKAHRQRLVASSSKSVAAPADVKQTRPVRPEESSILNPPANFRYPFEQAADEVEMKSKLARRHATAVANDRFRDERASGVDPTEDMDANEKADFHRSVRDHLLKLRAKQAAKDMLSAEAPKKPDVAPKKKAAAPKKKAAASPRRAAPRKKK